MLRARRVVAALLALAVVALSLAAGGRARADAPDYSPLPPPPAPAVDLAARGRPVPRVVPASPTVPPVNAASPATSAPPATTTTTTSAVLGAPSPSLGESEPSAPPRSRSSLDDDRFSVAPLLGFASDNLDLGVGVRAGTTAITAHLWVGGTFVYHLGTSTSGTVAGARYATSSSAFYAGPEIGYDLELGPVVLRPYGGIGLAGLSASATATNGIAASNTVTKLVLWPGATVLYGLPASRFFVGGDTRFVTIPGGPAIGLFGLCGMTL